MHFKVIADDDPEKVLIKETSTACWIDIVKRINDF
jgi:hypothetical protein